MRPLNRCLSACSAWPVVGRAVSVWSLCSVVNLAAPSTAIAQPAQSKTYAIQSKILGEARTGELVDEALELFAPPPAAGEGR